MTFHTLFHMCMHIFIPCVRQHQLDLAPSLQSSRANTPPSRSSTLTVAPTRRSSRPSSHKSSSHKPSAIVSLSQSQRSSTRSSSSQYHSLHSPQAKKMLQKKVQSLRILNEFRKAMKDPV